MPSFQFSHTIISGVPRQHFMPPAPTFQASRVDIPGLPRRRSSCLQAKITSIDGAAVRCHSVYLPQTSFYGNCYGRGWLESLRGFCWSCDGPGRSIYKLGGRIYVPGCIFFFFFLLYVVTEGVFEINMTRV